MVEPDGVWLGSLAGDLGLAGRTVDAATFSTVLDGREPDGRVLNRHRERVEVAAFDLLLTAPKSVSVLHALGTDEASSTIRRAHDESVEATVGYLERNVAYLRRSSGGVQSVVASEGLVIAGFLHRTSRAPDPHLHTHLVVANLGRDRGGTWSALDARELFAHISAASALYRSHLRRDLVKLDGRHFTFRRSGAVDLVGARDATIRLFSRRSAAIDTGVDDFGSHSDRARQIESHRTRSPKDLTTSWEDLVDGWRAVAARSGLAQSEIDGLGHSRLQVEPTVLPEVDPGAVVGAFERPFSPPGSRHPVRRRDRRRIGGRRARGARR